MCGILAIIGNGKDEVLVKELSKGEKSGFVKDFNRNTFLKDLHNKHLSK